jgi:hypothetical protein
MIEAWLSSRASFPRCYKAATGSVPSSLLLGLRLFLVPQEPLSPGPARQLVELDAFVAAVGYHEEVVPGPHHPCEPDEESRIHAQHSRHIAGYHLRRLLGVRHTREDDAPVGDRAPEVGGLGAHGAVQERLERRRHGGGRGRGRPASRRRGRGEGRASGARRLPEYDPAELLE